MWTRDGASRHVMCGRRDGTPSSRADRPRWAVRKARSRSRTLRTARPDQATRRSEGAGRRLTGERRVLTLLPAQRSLRWSKPCRHSRSQSSSTRTMSARRSIISGNTSSRAGSLRRRQTRLLIATWNIANFGVQERTGDDRQLIADVVGWFDAFAVQETHISPSSTTAPNSLF